MSKFLFATMPITGHVNPGLPIARELVKRGHEVRWYTGAKFKTALESVGAHHIPAGDKVDFDDTDIEGSFPGRSKVAAGLPQLKFDIREVFTNHIPYSTREIQTLLKSFPAEAIIVDTTFGTGPMISELGGPPCIAYGISALPLPSDEVAPFGLGLLPDDSYFGCLRNRALAWMCNNVLFKDNIAHRNAVRDQFNLPASDLGIFEAVVLGSKLYLQGTIPELEYPRSNMPSNIRFIGPLLPDQVANQSALPEWWHEMLDAGKPVVHVSQGTIATDPHELILPAIDALAGEDVLVVVSSKSIRKHIAQHLPSNVRVAPFLPYVELMKHVDVFLTNGGYGGVHFALSQGVPVVVAGATEDKPEVANRVARSGAGINLRTNRPSAYDIRRAVQKAIKRPRYRQAAQSLATLMAKHNAPARAAELIESVARERAASKVGAR